MAEDDEVQSWFSGLSFKLKRELAATIKEEADGLASVIKSKAPVRTGKLRDSVKVQRRRNELQLDVVAGGTTADAKGLDYALFTEFGTVNEPAQPFFYNTAREMLPDIQQRIEDKVEEIISRS